MRVGVMGCSSFAHRAMIPALLECRDVELDSVSSRSMQKASAFAAEFGCKAVAGYEALLSRDDIDAIYVPLPTGLHEVWCSMALEHGKHLLVEKSFAEDLGSAMRMIELARRKNLLIFENFQFQVHEQWNHIKDCMKSGKLGEVHLVRSTFGFPPLPKDNFRWDKTLGGGALLDAGAYMTKASQLLLGAGLEVLGASLMVDDASGVDVYGEAMLRNGEGQVAQVAFGFDYFYQCRVELLGTKGKLSTDRVFTAPPGLQPVMRFENEFGVEEIRLPADNHFVNMWQWFADAVRDGNYEDHWSLLADQARIISRIREVTE